MPDCRRPVAGDQAMDRPAPGDLLATEILAVVGPGRVLHVGSIATELLCTLAGLGCDMLGTAADGEPAANRGSAFAAPPAGGDTLLLGYSATAGNADLPGWLQSLRRRVGRNIVILPPHADEPSPRDLSLDPVSVATAAIAAGYRRHPAAYGVADFERSNDDGFARPMFFELIPDPVLARWPLQRLRAERDLHMDMTREGGPRSDAHLVRYALAAEWIRPGDSVLDCACGLGYGTAVLAARSPGRRFLGVDIDPGSVAYATDNFAAWGAEYLAASATRLDRIDARSIDTLVSFETLEHLEDYPAFLTEAARVLRPGGRIIVSVPNLWIDASGRDPNPHHYHVFHYAKCRAALEFHFRIEARYAQSAPGGTKLLDAQRQLRQRPLLLDPNEADTEWWIVLASAAANDAADRLHTASAAARPADDGSAVAAETVSKHLAAGIRELVAGRDDAAREILRKGIDVAVAALRSFPGPNGAIPSAATLAEVGEICERAQQCAAALEAQTDYRRAPGWFWRRVYARRVDSTLALRAVEDRNAESGADSARKLREMDRLRVELERLRATSTLRALLPLRLKEVFLTILPRFMARLFGRGR